MENYESIIEGYGWVSDKKDWISSEKSNLVPCSSSNHKGLIL